MVQDTVSCRISFRQGGNSPCPVNVLIFGEKSYTALRSYFFSRAHCGFREVWKLRPAIWSGDTCSCQMTINVSGICQHKVSKSVVRLSVWVSNGVWYYSICAVVWITSTCENQLHFAFNLVKIWQTRSQLRDKCGALMKLGCVDVYLKFRMNLMVARGVESQLVIASIQVLTFPVVVQWIWC